LPAEGPARATAGQRTTPAGIPRPAARANEKSPCGRPRVPQDLARHHL